MWISKSEYIELVTEFAATKVQLRAKTNEAAEAKAQIATIKQELTKVKTELEAAKASEAGAFMRRLDTQLSNMLFYRGDNSGQEDV